MEPSSISSCSTALYWLPTRRFVSVLAYRAGHMEAFQELVGKPGFSGIFFDHAAITAFVGENKIQLRSAVTIREKGHFWDPASMQILRTECEVITDWPGPMLDIEGSSQRIC